MNQIFASVPRCLLAAGGGVLALAILKSLFGRFKAHKAYTYYMGQKEKKLLEIQQGYKKLKQLHRKEFSPEFVKRVSRAGLVELQELLTSGELTSTDLVAIFGERAYTIGMRHGWIADQMFEQAYHMAEDRDKERSQAKVQGRKLSKLHGIPFSMKDHIHCKGSCAHWGRLSYLFKASDQTALMIQHLIADGAIPLVKSTAPTMPALTTESGFTGLCKNPFDPTRNTGGSSGGEAGLVGGDCIPFGIGSDQAGSLRAPSSWCKVTTLCPSLNRIQIGGASLGLVTKQLKVPESILHTTIGPMCKNTEDCQTVMECWCTRERLEQHGRIMKIPLREEDVDKYSGKKLRIGYYVSNGFVKPCPAVARVVREAKQILQEKGHTLVEIEIPDAAHYSKIFLREVFKDQGKSIADSMDDNEPTTKGMRDIKKIAKMPHFVLNLISKMIKNQRTVLLKAARGKELVDNAIKLFDWKEKVLGILQEAEVDALLSPIAEIHAVRVTDFKYGVNFVNTSFVNFLGFTAGVVPFGRVTEDDERLAYEDYKNDELGKGMKKAIAGSTGLPVAVQLWSYPGRESLVLNLMKQVEEEVKERNNYHANL